MGLFRALGRLIKPGLDVKTWTDSTRLIGTGKEIYVDAKKFKEDVQRFKDNAVLSNKENFSQAQRRFALSDDEVERLQTKFLLTAVLYFILGIVAFFYFGNQILHGGPHPAGNIGKFAVYASFLVAVLLAFTTAFRYHFWYYQVRERKLGCTVSEWFSCAFKRKRQ